MKPVSFIAEFGQVGDLAVATKQALAAQEIGAEFVKWQMFQPDRLVSRYAKRYWDSSLGGSESQAETFVSNGMLGDSEWKELFDYCRAIGIKPMATPFDLESVDLLVELDSPAIKIASGDITHRRLIEHVAMTSRDMKVFLSTGAATMSEIRTALGWIDECAPTLLACDLVYPCLPENAGLVQQLRELRDMYPLIGYSDHTQNLVTGAVAVLHGATVLEKHVTLDPDGDSPDDRMALTVPEARQYLNFARNAQVLCQPVEGDPQAQARIGARRSAYAARDLIKGQELASCDIAWLRPCVDGAISPAESLLGMVLTKNVSAGESIEREHVGIVTRQFRLA